MATATLPEDRAWVIYALRDPRNGDTRYIGFTSRLRPRERLRHHISASNNPRTPVHSWIKTLIAAGVKPEFIILETGFGPTWADRERAFIAEFRARGHRLLNLSEGGESPNVSPEARKRAGQKLRNRYFSPDHRRRISEAKKGSTRPDTGERNRRTARNKRAIGDLFE
jgi:hypothetical protein